MDGKETTMKVLVGCEFSGVVRNAFRQRGHEAWSCDLLPAADGSPYHLQADLNFVLNYPDRVLGGMPRWMTEVQWDLLIAHPPCTYLANSGVKHLYKGGRKENGPDQKRWQDMHAAADFFRMLYEFKGIPKRAIENPIMHKHGRAAIDLFAPSQIFQPWEFGHKEMKATCLWLRNLPVLQPTNIVGPPPKDREVRKSWARVHRESPSPDRWKRRSITLQGIADAMADQWGNAGPEGESGAPEER